MYNCCTYNKPVAGSFTMAVVLNHTEVRASAVQHDVIPGTPYFDPKHPQTAAASDPTSNKTMRAASPPCCFRSNF